MLRFYAENATASSTTTGRRWRSLARQNSNSPIAEGVLLPDLSAYLLGEGFATWEKVLGEQCVHMAPDRAQRDVEGL
jgi:hypothetical protein